MVPNTTGCAVAGVLSAGMICGETEKPDTWDLDFAGAVTFLEPQPASPDGKTPARGAAICQPDADWTARNLALEIACRDLGPNCTPEAQAAIAADKKLIERLHLRIQLLLEKAAAVQ